MAGAAFLYEVHRLHRASRRDEAGGGDRLVTMRLFHLSLVYLTVVFAAVAAGALHPLARFPGQNWFRQN